MDSGQWTVSREGHSSLSTAHYPLATVHGVPVLTFATWFKSSQIPQIAFDQPLTQIYYPTGGGSQPRRVELRDLHQRNREVRGMYSIVLMAAVGTAPSTTGADAPAAAAPAAMV